MVAERGNVRWPRPASQPLDEEWKDLNSADVLERSDLLLEAASLPMWHEMPDRVRKDAIISDAEKWNWSGSPSHGSMICMKVDPWGVCLS